MARYSFKRYLNKSVSMSRSVTHCVITALYLEPAKVVHICSDESQVIDSGLQNGLIAVGGFRDMVNKQSGI